MLSKSDDDDDDDDDDDESEQQQTSKKIIKGNLNAFNERINKEEADINKDLFKEHFNFQRPSDMLKYLHRANDREKKIVSVINSWSEDLNKKN